MMYRFYNHPVTLGHYCPIWLAIFLSRVGSWFLQIGQACYDDGETTDAQRAVIENKLTVLYGEKVNA